MNEQNCDKIRQTISLQHISQSANHISIFYVDILFYFYLFENEIEEDQDPMKTRITASGKLLNETDSVVFMKFGVIFSNITQFVMDNEHTSN